MPVDGGVCAKRCVSSRVPKHPAAVGQLIDAHRSTCARACVARAPHPARQVELSSARERYDAAAGEAAAAVREGTALRQALTSMEARLSEFQRKDVEVGSGSRGSVICRYLLPGGLLCA